MAFEGLEHFPLKRRSLREKHILLEERSQARYRLRHGGKLTAMVALVVCS